MWFNILGFWMVGFTMGWALTFKAGLGLSGIWLGILGGVTTTGDLPSNVSITPKHFSLPWHKLQSLNLLYGILGSKAHRRSEHHALHDCNTCT